MHKTTNSVTKLSSLSMEGSQKQIVMDVDMLDKKSKPKISSIAHFYRVNDGWVSGLLKLDSVSCKFSSSNFEPFGNWIGESVIVCF